MWGDSSLGVIVAGVFFPCSGEKSSYSQRCCSWNVECLGHCSLLSLSLQLCRCV